MRANNRSYGRHAWLGGAALIALAGAGGPAWAQGAAPGAQTDATTLEQVVVTASRAAPTGFTAPTPTSVISSDVLARQGASNIAQVLNQSPAFKGTINPSANGVRTQTPGSSNADLRGLGANRTLLLVDGMRVVPLAPTNTTGVTVSPDMNAIPSLLVDRIEVVTGGASAQWGSDAVSGVVNILLKSDFEGLMARAQAGVSQRGDGKEKRFGFLAGRGFLGDRFHVVLGADLVDNDGLGDIYTRGWGKQEFQIVANPSPATNGLPANLLAANVHASSAPGGLITGPANFSLRNYTFVSPTELRPFTLGGLAGGTVMIGGEGRALAAGVALAPSVRRANPYLHLEYKPNDALTLFAEASYAYSEGRTQVLPSRDAAITIRRDNAYLPASVAAAMDAARITSFTMSRLNYDVGVAQVRIVNRTPHLATGAKGDLGGGWTWDAHYAWGRNTYRNAVSQNRIRPNFAFATDAVLSGGQAVCRATLPGAGFNAAAAGCVPINLFGVGSPSAAAKAYVLGVEHASAVYTQNSAAANIRGEPLHTWAGPVSVAAGLEYRRESEDAQADPIAQAGNYEAANATAFRGDFDVKEGYVEAVVPLATSLDLNGAVRFANYSSAGDQTTWKLGGVFTPFEGLRLRVTRSRDIRAPALFELFSAGSVSIQPASVRGQTATIPANTTVGNPNLRPEKADTLTLGAVIEPKGSLSGLRVSADFFDIRIDDAITTLSVSNAAGLCNAGQANYCAAFTFNTAGAPTSLTLPVQNAATVRSAGLDAAVSYRSNLSLFGVDGTLSSNLSATWVDHTYVNLGNGAGKINRAGENSQLNTYAIPHLRANLSSTYAVGPASLTAQVVFVGKGHIDNTFNTSAATTINDNDVPAITYLNLFGSYDLTDRLQLTGAITNVLDKDPPPVPSTTLFTPTNGAYYDTVGRAFQVGLTYRF